MTSLFSKDIQLPIEIINKLTAYLNENKLMIIKRPEFCNCNNLILGLAIGRDGDKSIDCESCGERCTKCDELSSQRDYRTNIGEKRKN